MAIKYTTAPRDPGAATVSFGGWEPPPPPKIREPKAEPTHADS